MSLLIYVLHKTRNLAFSRRSRAKTGKKCTKKCDARTKLLLCLLNLLFFLRSRCRPRRWILKSLLMAGTEYFGQTAVQLHTGQHYAEITQSHPFAALIRLSTTTHNLLTFNISEILSNNSEKLSLLPDKDLWTFLLHSSYSSSRM